MHAASIFVPFNQRLNHVILSRAANPGVKDLNQARFSAYLRLKRRAGDQLGAPNTSLW
jgi:hypothetical protein